MFHILGEENESQDLQEDSGLRTKGRWDMRYEIFRETTAGAAPLLDLEGPAYARVCVCLYHLYVFSTTIQYVN